MGDLQVGEAFKDKVFLIETATGNPHLLQAPSVVVIDESGNRAAGVVAEESDGWYTCTFTPDAAGTWALEYANAGSTFVNNYVHYFKVGGGEITDIKADTADIHTDVGTIDAFHDVPAQNAVANSQIRDVVGNKTDTTAGDSLVAIAKQIKAKTDNLPADPADESNTQGDLDAILADTNELQGDWVNGGRLDLLIDAIKARTDNRLQTVTYFSPCQIEVVADTTHTDASLPTVTIPNITGTIVHVYAGFKFRMIENTNAAANKLSGAQEIQINKAGGAWTDAINFVDDQFGLAASTREGGDCIIGYTDLVGTIDVFNTTAQFQWDEPLTDKDALHFNDVQTFVIIQYY
jgi:hypothetical protein